MKTQTVSTTLSTWALLAALVATGATAMLAYGRSGPAFPPQIPQDPYRFPPRLLSAQRFQLEKPAAHDWRAERPMYDAGWLLVLEVEPALVFPRQGYMPVLYVGDQTANVINSGYESGRIVAIVPGDFFLAEAPIFFGRPGLPEEITAADIAVERDRAREAGIAPRPADEIAAVLHDDLRLRSDYELRRAAIALVKVHSPQERDLIRNLDVPRVR